MEQRIKQITLYDALSQNHSKALKYINNFECERMIGLKEFLSKNAVQNENNGCTRTYLVFDSINDQLVGYYTQRTSAIINDINDELREYIRSDNPQLFYVINQNPNIVKSVTSCIEITHFGLNDTYLSWLKHKGMNFSGLGNYIFKELITPTLAEIHSWVGYSLVILFAKKHPKVIESYHNMGFETIDDDEFNIIPVLEGKRPIYEIYTRDCVFMCQSTEKLFNL